MKTTSRAMMAFAALTLATVFLFPIWKITLIAPQYPGEGISLFIWIYKITGDTPYSLQNINILNHYVGMKHIEPNSIPELSYFPYVIGGMVVLALFFAAIGKRILYLTWTLIMGVLGILGIYDFYLWEYDYGHHLDPTAPIKVPGMTYQPPLLGEKYLLNFLAKSYPSWGSISIALSLVLAVVAFYIHWKHEQRLKN